MLKPKDPQQVFGIHQTARGMEPILARSSRCPCAGLKAMRRDRDRQKTKLENKLTGQYMCTGHATTLAMPPPSLTLSQHGKHKKGYEGDEGEKTRTKKRRGRAACLSQEKPAFLFSVCFSYLKCTKLAASRLDRSLPLAICMSLLCLSRIFPRAGSISSCTQSSSTATQRLRKIGKCSQRKNSANRGVVFFH